MHKFIRPISLMGSIGFIGFIFPIAVFAYFNPGSPKGFVNDFAGMLSVEERSSLENKLQQFERSSSNEITIVTIPNFQGDTIENFSVKLFEEWKIGKTKNDNGILLLIAKDDRQVRIEVGYGLEGALTDAQNFSIIQNLMAPAFQAGKYFSGIDAAVDAIISATRGEYLPEQPKQSSSFSPLFIVIIFFWIVNIILNILGRTKSWWLGGVLGGLVGVGLGLMFGFLFIGLGSIVVFGLLGLFLDYSVSKAYGRSGVGGPGRWPPFGGFGGGGRFGGGGFGGFGGGRSGGGGASGRW